MPETDFEVEIQVAERGDNQYTATIMPFHVIGYASTRKGASARAREGFANLVAAYEADGNMAQLVDEYERLKRTGASSLADLLIEMPQDDLDLERMTIPHRSPEALG